MVEKIVKEYTENGVAYNTTTLLFCGVPIYKCIRTTTNTIIVNQLKTDKQKSKIIKGFNNGDNKSKKN